MAPMTCTDYFGFASLFVLLIGSVNWGVVAIRYAVGDGLYNITEIGSGEELADLYRSKYNEYPTPSTSLGSMAYGTHGGGEALHTAAAFLYP